MEITHARIRTPAYSRTRTHAHVPTHTHVYPHARIRTHAYARTLHRGESEGGRVPRSTLVGRLADTSIHIPFTQYHEQPGTQSLAFSYAYDPTRGDE